MSPDIIEIIMPLTFFGVCCLVGGILVESRRERAVEEQLHMPPAQRRERRKKLDVRS